MDYLTTNWTEKMKTNPVANMVLNGRPRMLPFEFRKLTSMDNFEQDPNTGYDRISKWDALESKYIPENKWLRTMFHNMNEDYILQMEPDDVEELVEADKAIYIAHDMNQPPIDSDPWDNVYVKDYINIHHPKLRPCLISALNGKPLQIKPPSVFFSDV